MRKQKDVKLFTTVTDLTHVKELRSILEKVIGKGLRDSRYELKPGMRKGTDRVKSYMHFLYNSDGSKVLELNIPLYYTNRDFRKVRTRFAIDNDTGQIYLLRQCSNITAFRADIAAKVAEEMPDRRVRLNDCGAEKDNWLWVCNLTRISMTDIINFAEAVEKCRDGVSEQSGKKHSLTNEIMVIMSQKIPETEKSQLIKARLGQGKYRQHLVRYWNGCAVTGCKNLRLLVASHIKPWNKCGNGKEKLDKFNGLLLVPNLDRAFDEGLITFDDKGSIIISPRLSRAELIVLSVSRKMRLRKINDSHKHYLEYHRKYVFMGEK